MLKILWLCFLWTECSRILLTFEPYSHVTVMIDCKVDGTDAEAVVDVKEKIHIQHQITTIQL